jgi:hypothetical protein
MFILHDPLNPGGGRKIDSLSIYDIAPTLLAMLEQPIPGGLRGRVVDLGGATSDDEVYTDEEEDEVTERLRDLGYLSSRPRLPVGDSHAPAR